MVFYTSPDLIVTTIVTSGWLFDLCVIEIKIIDLSDTNCYGGILSPKNQWFSAKLIWAFEWRNASTDWYKFVSAKGFSLNTYNK